MSEPVILDSRGREIFRVERGGKHRCEHCGNDDQKKFESVGGFGGNTAMYCLVCGEKVDG